MSESGEYYKLIQYPDRKEIQIGTREISKVKTSKKKSKKKKKKKKKR